MKLLCLFRISVKRLWESRWLALATLIGQATAVALVVAVPLFADGTSRSLLERKLHEGEDRRPPFAFVFGYTGHAHGPLSLGDFRVASAYLDALPELLGLPVHQSVQYAQSDTFTVLPGKDSIYADSLQGLTWGQVAFLTQVEAHIQVVEGHLPAVAPSDSAPMEALISERLASELGLQAGEEYLLYTVIRDALGARERTILIPMRIAGIWVARDPQEDYWPFGPSALNQVFLVPEESFASHVAATIEKPVASAIWYSLLDGQLVRAGSVDALLARISRVQAVAGTHWPGVRLSVSPKERLLAYREARRLLTILLYIFSLPTLGLILYFIAFVSGQTVQRQRSEIATLRSRGASVLQVAGLQMLECLPLSALAAGVGTFAGSRMALLVGRLVAFLDFRGGQSFRVLPDWETLACALLAAAFSAVTAIGPAIVAARHTIVSYKTEVARKLPAPAWQRYSIDMIALLPPLYGYYLLRRRETVPVVGWGLLSGDPFQNPLLFVVPTLFILAWALLAIRLFPHAVELLGRLGERFLPVSLLLAERRLARSTWLYRPPLLLLILTISLATFTASMARTLDRNIEDHIYYRVGADLKLAEPGEVDTQSIDDIVSGRVPPGTLPRWLFPSVEQHALLPGVRGATRFADFGVETEHTDRGTLIGIDRLEFPQVGFYRDSYAAEPLGALLNQLALHRDGVLVSRSFLQRSGLAVGERVRLAVDLYPRAPTYGLRKTFTGTVVGVLDLFPPVDPSRGPFFVANLNAIFEQIGSRLPYEVLLATLPSADTQAILVALRAQGVSVVAVEDAHALVRAERERPERRGTFGILSIGFVASAALTVLGFLLYTLASLRSRQIELGILRALGLSAAQLRASLACEQLMLIASGLLIGTLLGVWTSSLFIPFLQVGASAAERVPPYVVRIAWADIGRIYALFGTVLLIASAGLLLGLRRLRISSAIKLGEQML